MSEARQKFLQRVRDAVVEGNRVNEFPTAIPDRAGTGYQGAGSDPVARYLAELKIASGHGYTAVGMAAARDIVADLLRRMGPKIVLLGRWQLPVELNADALIRDVGATVLDSENIAVDGALTQFATADVGLTGCDHLIAETGSVVVRSRPEQPRSVSLLPPFHIVVARESQIVPDVFDLFAMAESPPAGLTLITGPSKTGDIEGILVTGVHGPGELHVVVVTGE